MRFRPDNPDNDISKSHVSQHCGCLSLEDHSDGGLYCQIYGESACIFLGIYLRHRNQNLHLRVPLYNIGQISVAYHDTLTNLTLPGGDSSLLSGLGLLLKPPYEYRKA